MEWTRLYWGAVRRLGFLLVMVALLWPAAGPVLVSTASAGPIPVVNHDFEAGTAGWTTVSGSGVFPPTWTDAAGGHYNASGQPAGVGGSVAWGNNPGGGLYQQVGTLQADTVYELSVAVGQRKDIAVSGWEMWLRLDSPGWNHASPPAIDFAKIDHTSGSPASGYFVDKTVTANSADFPANYMGKNLYVTVYAGATAGVQTNFDNVRVVATPGPGAYTIMDEEAAVEGGTGWGGNSNEGYNRDIRYSNNASATATWTFSGLADGQYDVLASWSLHANRSSDVSYTVGSSPAVHVNQEMYGTGLYLAGSPASGTYLFDYLDGPVTVSGGSLTVTASNNRSGSNDYLIADAVAIRPAGPRTYIIDNKSADFTTDFPGGNNEGFVTGIRYTAANASSAGMESSWSFTDLADGMYKVYATWSTDSNRTQAAPFSVWDGSGQLGSTVPVNQEANPYRNARDLNSVDTVNWRGLGSYRVSDGTLTVKLNGLDNTSVTEYVIADAVRVEPIAPSATAPWIGVFRANPSSGADPWYFTHTITRPTVSDETNPGWGEGALGDRPVAGDWDGDGTDGIAVFRTSVGGQGTNWYLSNNRTTPTSDYAFHFGDGTAAYGDLPVAGDWDGDGADGVGVFRTAVGGQGTNWYLANDPASPGSDYTFHYGDGTAAYRDLPVAGDWDGDGLDTVGVFRTNTNTWYLNNGLGSGPTAFQFVFGQAGDVPVAEDWDKDGMDDVGLFRPSTGEWFFDVNFDGIADFYNPGYGSGLLGDIPLAGHVYIPEPCTLALCGLALAGLGGYVRRRRAA